ncbi:TIGR03619 family F420-dependent LLM class oxidoreductase [Nocardia sp. NPDC049149]|uniref:TIGR03619 family F420-dependent LLM class oxidoreductase n=1 Tax=Nocardia sp. NPDC049149 TaxID=3364315 RepID=UPI003718C198
MRIGLALPQYGGFADPAAIVAVSKFAEASGFDSLWVGDRLLVASEPRGQYPGGQIPPGFAHFLDPLTVLTVAAGVTDRVRLGTNTLNALWQPPMLLARTVASLDQVSAGRLDVGIGLGWSPDEYEALGVPWPKRGARLEETLDVLETAWAPGPVEYVGERWTVPHARIDLKPRQTPRPPILLGGHAPATLERVGRRADGWLAGPLPIPVLTGMWATIERTAEKNDRDPSALRLVVRINPAVETDDVDPKLVPRRGSVTQLAGYAHDLETAGAHEVMFDLQTSTNTVDELIATAAELHAAITGQR